MSEQALNPELVRAFVGAAHSELEKVQELLEQEPNLLNAAMNWGGGDWETAVGAAAHTGRKDILRWLLEQGARLDLFAAAMLGELDMVKAVLERFPGQLHANGPHGISLLQHALMGGEEAAATAEYLRSLQATSEPDDDNGVILVENRIIVRSGYGEAVLERFAKPKQVHKFKGFIRMDVLHGRTPEGEEEIRVCTMWERKEDFEAWASSDNFRSAHARRAAESQAGEGRSPHADGSPHGEASSQSAPAAKAEAPGPIIGNKVSIYRVAASHLPAGTEQS